jgi:hypothetical protein
MMKPRDSLRTLAALILAVSTAGCGVRGGSLVAPATAPAGRIDPGAVLVLSATPVQLRQLRRNANYWQAITSGRTHLANGKVLVIGPVGDGSLSNASVEVLE